MLDADLTVTVQTSYDYDEPDEDWLEILFGENGIAIFERVDEDSFNVTVAQRDNKHSTKTRVFRFNESLGRIIGFIGRNLNAEDIFDERDVRENGLENLTLEDILEDSYISSISRLTRR